MEIQSAPRQLGNQRSNRNVVKGKQQSPQRMVSTSSAAETSVDTDTEEDEEDNNDAELNFTGPQRVRAQQSDNQAESISDDECFRYEILLWFGSSLGGVSFSSCDSAGYPYVEKTDSNESLPGMWNIQDGDFLVSVNECSAHSSTMTFDSVMQILTNGARPAVLHFRRPTLLELQNLRLQKRKPTSEERLGRRRNRERLEKTLSYVIWREGDGPLGVSLKKQKDSLYPVVADMNRSSIVSRHARVGDQLISINQHDIYKLGNKRWVQLLKAAPKPLVLTFRRLNPPPIQKGARTLDL